MAGSKSFRVSGLYHPALSLQVYRGHNSLVRCLSVSPDGQWLASGGHAVGQLRSWAGWAGLEGQVLRACLRVQVQMMARCDSGRWPLPAA